MIYLILEGLEWVQHDNEVDFANIEVGEDDKKKLAEFTTLLRSIAVQEAESGVEDDAVENDAMVDDAVEYEVPLVSTRRQIPKAA